MQAGSPSDQHRFVAFVPVGVQGSQRNRGDEEEQGAASDAAVLHSALELKTLGWVARNSG